MSRIRTVGFALTIVSSSLAAAGPPSQLEHAVLASYPRDVPRSFSYSLFDLNEDGIPDALVMITDPLYCGSGGCVLVVFQGLPDGSFRRVSASTVTREPIRVLKAKTHGWHDFTVSVSGGGVRPCLKVMRFDGSRYPSNPSLLACATPGAVHWSVPVKMLPSF